MKLSDERHATWPLIVGIILGVLALTAGPAFAALTFSGTSITGDSSSVIDATGTISIGASSATGITIGRSGITATFPATVSNPTVTSSLWYGTSTGTVVPLLLGTNLSISNSTLNASASGGATSTNSITYLAPFASSTSRTLTSKLGETVSVTDFGAIGDGSAHPLSGRYGTLAAAQAVYPFVTSLTQQIDWAASQAAINSLATVDSHGTTDYGGDVEFPRGNYVMSNPLVIAHGYTHLIGYGAIITAADGDTISITTGDAHVVIEGLYFYGPGTATSHGVHFSGLTTNSEVLNCIFANYGSGGAGNGNGILLDTANQRDMTISGNQFYTMGGDDIVVNSPNDGLEISENLTDSTAGWSIYMDNAGSGAGAMRIEHNLLVASTGHIYLGTVGDVIVQDNEAEMETSCTDAHSAAFDFAGSGNVQVSGNSVNTHNLCNYGIYVGSNFTGGKFANNAVFSYLTDGFDIVSNTGANQYENNLPVSPSTAATTYSVFPANLVVHAPAITTYASHGSGTYTTPAGAMLLHVRMCGAGGGGAAVGGGAAGAGGNSTFGTSLLTANGGSAGGSGGEAGVGGSASGGSINLTGAAGQGGAWVGADIYLQGGNGGTGLFGSAGGRGGYFSDAATAGSSCGGGGGSGASSTADGTTGAGGGSGGYVEAWITNPTSTYNYAVGTGGTAGSAGGGGYAGAAGGDGIIIIEAQ